IKFCWDLITQPVFYGKAARLQLVENALTVQPLN
ncbi:hypothetical protein ACUOA8_37455, partial [Escherichia sp. SS-MK2]